MTSSQRRIALLTGASISTLGISALGLATPALAAPHDSVTPNVYYPGGTATSDIAICDIAGTEPCFYGIVAEASPTATANVDTTAEGRIYQNHLGNTNLVLSNTGDSAEVGAIASVTGTPAAAVANASLASAVEQWAGWGSTDTVTLDNGDGSLLIDAVASAVGGTAATANAVITNYGIGQFVGSAGSAAAVINVDAGGDITIQALANASATEGAAVAHAGMATTESGIGAGIVQSVSGSDAATAAINNGGVISVSAIASATGTSHASATANVDGIYQNAYASEGAATATIVNDGSIAVLASANANAANPATATEGVAIASANVSYGISQNAEGTAATVGIQNNALGSIDIGAVAHATGTAAGSVMYGAWNTTAFQHGAQAHINDGINQNALATGTYTSEGDVFAGDAAAQITNAGTIDIHASATAKGTLDGGGAAYANAGIGSGIEQGAEANGGNATVSLANTNSIDITAVANATGTVVTGLAGTNWSSEYYDIPGAHAAIYNGINQYATANGLVTATETAINTAAIYGDASVSLTNDGTINIAATANGDAGTDGRAWASAEINGGIRQHANANGVTLGSGTTATVVGGDASASLTNTSLLSIDISANAVATGTVATASASINTGISQDAYAAAGDASVLIDNSGAIAISAIATAHGTTAANANADVDGIYQNADAPNGDASAQLTNAGSIAVLASANATVANTDTEAAGLALANAYVSYGISQNADGINATVGLDNGAAGSIDIGAVAHATGTAARSVTYGTWSGTAFNHGAVAQVGDGIEQNATAGCFLV